MNILLNKPLKPELDKLTKYLEQVNNNEWYTNFGPLHEILTQKLESYLGVKNLLLVSNGTLALQVACKALDINSAITTPFSFVATTSSLLWQGIDIAFSDIDSESYNLCPEALGKALSIEPRYDGIVATHVYGNPCDVDAISQVALKYNKKVIYDAAHAFNVKVGSESVLNYGDASTLSFHATKLFHTVEGGAIVFKNKSDYEKAKQLINFGIDANGDLGEPGINAKLNEYQCAVGLTLLDEIDQVTKHRVELFELYRQELKDYVKMPDWHIKGSYNGAYMPIYIENKELLNKVIENLNLSGVQHRRYFTPSLDVAYKKQKTFSAIESRKISEGILCLPLHYYLKISDVLEVTNIIKLALKG
ncbi:DegT/DnrJ/EryC1/StrS family aminotransferase [Shewanella livingstonensis]|uniref:DegT/DnrJ/EryC1/StrS family aminotransferase n=1 Tax=Shewanella livingstonensis TaxID=150120 RepID=A0A3G8LXQ4_9GAMM|nr:DegT/DnrJ/EryC1/StrS family aminotransferase [Shewanella livingstonensis]AZG74187.1 DegT/DnrJ/EryC1/StrS family aminotransferase [Shewanella livingstonensis]